MANINVHIAGKDASYKVVIDTNFSALSVATKNASSIFIVTDDVVAPLWLDAVKEYVEVAHVIILPTGEKSKTLTQVERVWQELQEHGADRHSILINLGGGVICDLGGFAASTYKRGIAFIHIPTTLLSQADAAIGGKTGVDFNGLKNQIGTITQPKAVVINVASLSTLDDRLYQEGFGELIKHGCIADHSLFESFEDTPFVRKTDQPGLINLLEISSRIKVGVVSGDVRESGNRKILNFGHTIGHALEAASLRTDQPLLHGEAVSLGMVSELILIDEYKLQSRLKKVLVSAKLPVSLKTLPDSIENLMKLMRTDKKNIGGSIRFSIPNEIGKCDVDIEVPEKKIQTALESLVDDGNS